MAFCTFCGAQLNEGEEHICPNKPASTGSNAGGFDFSAITKSFVDDVIGWFKGEKASVGAITSGVFTVASYLFNSLFFVFMFVALSNKLTSLTGGWYEISLPCGVSFWWGLLVLLIGYAFTILLDMAKSGLAHEKIDIVGGLSKASTTSLVCSVLLFVGGLFGMLVWWLAVPFVLTAVVLRVRDYYALVSSIIKIKSAIFNNLAIAGAIAAIVAIGLWITSLCMKGYLEGLAGSAMNSLSGLLF